MPRNPTTPKEDIIEGAFQLIREQGHEDLPFLEFETIRRGILTAVGTVIGELKTPGQDDGS